MRNDSKILTCFVFVLCMAGIGVTNIFAFSSGPPNGRTGSPFDDFLTCRDGCHNSFELNAGTAQFSISAPGSYTKGETVDITVFFKNSDTSKHGFELSALDADDKHVGVFSSVDNKTQTDDGKGNYIKHTAAGSSQSGNASWKVKWTAPSSEVPNPVTFYAAGNEANGNFTNQGDYIYTTTRDISPVAPTPTPTTTAAVTPTPTPTPLGCETESLSASPDQLELERQASTGVVVTLIPSEGCPPEEGKIVTAKVNSAGKNRVSVSPQSATTDANGKAVFTITAGNKTGNARVKFRYENLKTTVKVKVVK